MIMDYRSNNTFLVVNGHQLLGKYDAVSLKMLNEKYPELFSDFVGDLDIEKRLRYEEMYSRFKVWNMPLGEWNCSR